MNPNACDKAIEILRATRDGNDLDPSDLKVLESAVNGFLTETGEVYFDDLYYRCTHGKYVKPWLHGVEHLTRDHQGYVYWKGQEIEHWSGPILYNAHAQAREQALELKRRCEILEAAGEPVNTTTVIWKWEDPHA